VSRTVAKSPCFPPYPSHYPAPIVRVMDLSGLEFKNKCAGEDNQTFQSTVQSYVYILTSFLLSNPVEFNELLPALVSIVIFGIGPRRNP
jgi:hypothetical protein